MKKLIVRQENDATYLDFYASVFNSKSKPITEKGKTFREIIRTGAYDGTDTSNVLATLYHDKNKIIGRSRAGTLALEVDDYGLKATVNMGDTSLHKDVMEMVERGDLDECSFIGRVTDWEDKYEDGELIRYINQIDLLKDVSIVGEGAYGGTNIIIREFMENKPTQEELEARVQELERELAEREEQPKEDTPKEEPKPEAPKEEEKPTEEAKREEQTPEAPKETAGEEVKRDLETNPNKIEMKNSLELIREAINSEGAKGTIDISRAAGDGESSNFTKLTPVTVKQLDIIGKAPVWAEMGVDYMPGCRGTVHLPYEDPIVAQSLAELAPVTKQTETDLGTAVNAKRYSATKVWSLETLSNMTDEGLQKQLDNLRKSCDRKLTADVFEVAFTAAGTNAVASVTAVDEAGLDALAAACDIDNEYSFLMDRAMFYAKKSTKIDAGSGKNLMTKKGKFGETFDGDDVYFSTLCPVGDKVAGGDLSKITVLDFDNEQVIIDNITLADKGQVKVTVVKMANVALRNPKAFSKSGVIA